MKPGDWGAAPDAGVRGFTLASFAVAGRAAPKPDPVEARAAEAERRLKQAEESHRVALEKAAREGDARAAAAEQKGREAGRAEGEKAAGEKYARSLEELRKGIRGVLESLSREKAALFLGYEGEAVALSAAAIKRVFEGLADSHAEAVLPLLRKAVAALGEVSAFTLKINPADFPVVDGNRPFWLPVEAGLKDIRIIPDDRIPKGGCLVESDATSVEMRAADLADRIGEAFSQIFEAKTRTLTGGGDGESAAPAPEADRSVPGSGALPDAGNPPSGTDGDESMPPLAGDRP